MPFRSEKQQRFLAAKKPKIFKKWKKKYGGKVTPKKKSKKK
jgi:hypothetical protein